MKYKYILFDWDGCMVDSLELWINSIQKGFEHNNIHISLEEVVENRLLNEWHRLNILGITDKKTFSEIVYTHYNNNTYSITLHEQVEQTLIKLKKLHFKTAVITSSYKNTFVHVLHEQKCHKYFDLLITRDDVSHNKPHPEPVEKAIELLHGSKDESIIIGDSYADILAGKNAHIATVWYYPLRNEQFYPPDFIADLKPDYTIKKMSELMKIIS